MHKAKTCDELFQHNPNAPVVRRAKPCSMFLTARLLPRTQAELQRHLMIEHPTPRLDQASGGHLPPRIAWFERLLYAGVIVSVVRLAIDQPNGLDSGAMVIGYSLLIAKLVMIWQAARRRKMWAAWALLGLFFMWVSFGILRDAIGLHLSGWTPPNPVSIALRFCQLVIEGIGLGLVFSRRGRRWFNPNWGRPRDWNDV